MAEISYEFSANERSAMQALANLERKYDSLDAKIKATARSSKKGAEEGTLSLSNMGKAAQQVIGMLGGVASAGAGISAVLQAAREELDQATDSANSFAEGLIRGIAASGDLANSEQIRTTLQETAGATPEQARQAFESVSGAAPRLELEKRLALAQQTAPLRAILGEGEVDIISQLAGRIQRGDEGVSAADAADLALKVFQESGGKANQLNTPGFERALESLRSRGASTEESLAVLLQGVEESIRPSSIDTLAAKIGEGQTVQDLFAGRVQLSQEQQATLDKIDQQVVRQQAGGLGAARGGQYTQEQLSLGGAADIALAVGQATDVELERRTRLEGELFRLIDRRQRAQEALAPDAARPLLEVGHQIQTFGRPIARLGGMIPSDEQALQQMIARQVVLLEEQNDILRQRQLNRNANNEQPHE